MSASTHNSIEILDFCRSSASASQKLLFDETPVIREAADRDFEIPASLYQRGFALFHHVDTPTHAREIVSSVLAHLDPARWPLLSNFRNRMQLAKIDRIPVCDDIVARSYQALHYDMGIPLVSDAKQTVYLFVALYCPRDSVPGKACTRVVFVPELLGQRKWDHASAIESRILTYTRKHGDGWFSPQRTNTLRLACFARVLDAVTQRYELTHFVDKTTGDWFSDEPTQDGLTSLEREAAFFRRCGLDLWKAETRVRLAPGDLLLVDNVRAVHGRIGWRRRAEIYQMLFGVPSASPQDIDALRNTVVSCFAPKIPIRRSDALAGSVRRELRSRKN